MADYGLPVYDKPREWIRAPRAHGISWDEIVYARKKDENHANWIVRDFEQIDGAVLLSKASLATTYHFAMLSNDHMLSEGPHTLPWPLTEEMFSHFDTYMEAISAITAELLRQPRRRLLLSGSSPRSSLFIPSSRYIPSKDFNSLLMRSLSMLLSRPAHFCFRQEI